MSDLVELRVSSAPFWHGGSRVSAKYANIMLAAMVPIVAGMIRYGLPAVGVVVMAVASAVLWDLVMNILTHRRKRFAFDGKAALVGLLLSMLLPAITPCWLVIVATFFAIGLVKGIYTKIVTTIPFNPVAVAMILLMVLQSGLSGLGSTVINCRFGYNPVYQGPVNAISLLMGYQAGGLGSTFGIGLLLGGVYLMLRGFIRWEMSLSFLVSMFATALLFHLYAPRVYAGPVFHLLAGYSLFAAFFLITDDLSSPVNFTPMLICGALGGVIVVVLRNIGFHLDGAIYAVLIINLLNPLMDRIRPRAIYGTTPK